MADPHSCPPFIGLNLVLGPHLVRRKAEKPGLAYWPCGQPKCYFYERREQIQEGILHLLIIFLVPLLLNSVRCTGFSKLDFGYLSSLFFISYLIILTFLSFSYTFKVFFKSLSSFPLFSATCFFSFFVPAVPMWDLSSPNQGFNLCPCFPWSMES